MYDQILFYNPPGTQELVLSVRPIPFQLLVQLSMKYDLRVRLNQTSVTVAEKSLQINCNISELFIYAKHQQQNQRKCIYSE